MPRLKELYEKEIVPKLMKEFGYKNKLAVPRLEKIVVNMGVGEATQDIRILDGVMNDLALITGQRPAIRRAKKSIAAFKLRAGQPVGCTVTIRGTRMWEFFDRLVNIALPRVRDFRGLPTRSFDGRGNYTLGLRDQSIFPEVDYSKIVKIKGMNVTICTTANTDEEARRLLELLGFPFRRR
ncbi:MAG: 50S ribosomal protein L5 [Acidobacteria bacterium]|nr:50S ribosomal protein L5 [Acidobacteriota bacterium]